MAVNGKKLFGAGRFFGINNVTNPTPTRFSIPQDMSISLKRSVKSLFGENQFAVDVSAGELEVSGKCTYATMVPRVLGDLMFGVTPTSGLTFEADGEARTAVANTTTVVNSATFVADLGVVNVTTGVRYVRVATTPVVGVSYTVAAGVYTFAAGDATVSVKISYLYTVVGSGQTMSVTNQPMGRVGGFQAVHVFPWTNLANVVEQDIFTLNSCVANDAEFGTKVGDYGKPAFGYTASVDANDVLGSFSFAEVA